jgi:uncharacterized OB-fold protein
MSDAEPLALSSGPYLDSHAQGGPRLIASECRACGHRLFPTAAVCPNCMSEDMVRLPLSREGKVYSFTVLRQSPPGFENPSVIAYVDMPEGVRIFTHLDMAPEQARCEMPVTLKLVEAKTDRYGRKVLQFKFAPMPEASR